MAMKLAALTAYCAPSPYSREPAVMWWERTWVWLAIALASLLPFLCTPIPPITDLYNHIGRYHVMLHYQGSPYLKKYYAFHWSIIPNMGQDALVRLFGPWLGAERAGYVMTAIIPPTMIMAIRQLSQQIHGRVQASSLLALPFAYSFPFLFGFVNYSTGVDLALWSIVAWMASTRQNLVLRSLMLAVLSTLVWGCHIAAWYVLLVVIFLIEASNLFINQHLQHLPRKFAILAMVLLPAILIPVILGRFGQGQARQGSMIRDILSKLIHSHLDVFIFKAEMLTYTLRDQNLIFDVSCQLAILLTSLALITWAHARMQCAVAMAAGALFALFWILPTALMGGYWTDVRLLPAAAILILVSLRLDNYRVGTMVAASALALFGARILVAAAMWHITGTQLAEDLQALDQVPRGARIAVLAPPRVCDAWRDRGITQLASLAIVRRDAFVNREWDIPGQQLMRPIYNQGIGYNSASSGDLASGPQCRGVTRPAWLTALPRSRFDYVWLMGRAASPLQLPWLKLQFKGPSASLYKVISQAGDQGTTAN